MKHLPKHDRPRWRYLAVELESWPDATLDRRAFQTALWRAARGLLGDPGSAAADLRLVGFAFADGDGTATVRARRGEVDAARAALACVDEAGGVPLGVQVLGASGTIRACEERYVDEPAEPVERRVSFRDATRRAVQRGDRLDVETNGGFTGATELDVE
ncbi:MAG: Rpp14/Pop5 family protein [Halobacteriaceae archaeon]